jgi:hypothetical protein
MTEAKPCHTTPFAHPRTFRSRRLENSLLRKVTTSISNSKQFFTLSLSLSLPNVIYTGFDVLAVATVKSVAFWVVMPCSLRNALSFVETYEFHIQGLRVSQSKEQNQVASLTTAGFLPNFPFDTEDESDFCLNLRDLSELRRVSIHKIEFLYWIQYNYSIKFWTVFIS